MNVGCLAHAQDLSQDLSRAGAVSRTGRVQSLKRNVRVRIGIRKDWDYATSSVKGLTQASCIIYSPFFLFSGSLLLT